MIYKSVKVDDTDPIYSEYKLELYFLKDLRQNYHSIFLILNILRVVWLRRPSKLRFESHDSNIATHVAFKDNMNDQADDAYDGRLRTNRRSRTGDVDCLFGGPF